MKLFARGKKYLPLGLIGGAIPTVLLVSLYFHLSQTLFIPIVTVLVLIFATMLLWAYANRKSDGSEWWQDDEASGWRGH